MDFSKIPLQNLDTRKVNYQISIKVHAGKNLLQRDVGSQSDPFVELSLKSEPWDIYKTKTINNNNNPNWDDKFNFFVFDTDNEEIFLNVKDDDKLLGSKTERSQAMGSATLNFLELLKHAPDYNRSVAYEVQLTPPANKEFANKSAGSLSIIYSISLGWYDKDRSGEKIRPLPGSLKDYTNFKNIVLEGGGVKGIAYGGAIQFLQKKGILNHLENVAGTSAGALAATMLAIGANGDQMTNMLLNETDFESYMDKRLGLFTVTLLTSHSLFEGEELEKDIKKKIKQVMTESLKHLKKEDYQSLIPGLSNIEETLSFQHLANLHKLAPHIFKNLSVIGTNVTLKRPQVFSAKTSPDFPIWKATRISMGLPLFFPPVWVDGCYYIDGGVAYNYPIDLFDHGDTLNSQTLGLKLDIPEEIATALTNYTMTAPRNLSMADTLLEADQTKEPLLFDMIGFISNLVSFLTNQVNDGKLKKGDDNRTIYINSGSVGTADFGLAPEKKKGLCHNGEKWANNFFAWYDSLF